MAVVLGPSAGRPVKGHPMEHHESTPAAGEGASDYRPAIMVADRESRYRDRRRGTGIERQVGAPRASFWTETGMADTDGIGSEMGEVGSRSSPTEQR